MRLSGSDGVQLALLVLLVAGGWLIYEHGSEISRRIRFGAELTPQVRASIAAADAEAGKAQAHAAEALRNRQLAQNAAAAARDAAQKSGAGVHGYASKVPFQERGATLYGYQGQVAPNGATQGLEVVNYGQDNKYEGEWKEGAPDGYGVMTNIGGRIHAGHWVAGTNVGDGFAVNSGMTWEGQLFGDGSSNNGYLGVLICEAGDICRSRAGHFEITSGGRINLDGPGVVVMRDGRLMKGLWSHGEQNGYGAILDAKGVMLEQGNYHNGQL